MQPNESADSAPARSEDKTRLDWVSQKLCLLHDGLAQDRDSRFEHLQGKMRQLDERVSASQDSLSKKFIVLKDRLLGFETDLRGEVGCREQLVQTKHRDLASVDKQLQDSLVSEQESRRLTEEKILHGFDLKVNALKDDIRKAGLRREDNQANLRRYLEFDVPKLFESIREEKENREAMEKRMMTKAMGEVAQLQAAVLAERKEREDTEEAMLRMMEDVVSKMQGDLSTERQQRERTEEQLLNLLNATCHRLQVASRSL
jgi:hypothetical protein